MIKVNKSAKKSTFFNSNKPENFKENYEMLNKGLVLNQVKPDFIQTNKGKSPYEIKSQISK